MPLIYSPAAPTTAPIRSRLSTAGPAWALALLCAAGFCGPALAADFPEARQRILEQFKKVTTLSAKFTSHVVQEGYGRHTTTDGNGTVVMKRGDEKTLVRMDMTFDSMELDEREPSQKQLSVMSISDGEVVHTLRESDPGQFMAFKMLHSGSDTFDVKEIMDALAAKYSVTVLPDEAVEGEPTIVLEATPTVLDEKEQIVRRRYFFAKNSGLLLKRSGYTRKGDEVETFHLRNPQLGIEIDPKRFEFTPPPGVRLVDMIAEQQKSAGSAASKPAPK